MKLRIAYVEEPPFYWKDEDHSVKGADIELAEVALRAIRVDGMIQIKVQDNGLGMTAEDQQNLFSNFFRSSDDKVREAPGTGLGLSITKNLIELQGGRIWFESEFRKGTTFFFTVPVYNGQDGKE